MAKLMIVLIRVYQRWISPLLGNQCRFVPSCSQYAIEALERYGALQGSCYALWRIMRCNPFCRGGLDPIR